MVPGIPAALFLGLESFGWWVGSSTLGPGLSCGVPQGVGQFSLDLFLPSNLALRLSSAWLLRLCPLLLKGFQLSPLSPPLLQAPRSAATCVSLQEPLERGSCAFFPTCPLILASACATWEVPSSHLLEVRIFPFCFLSLTEFCPILLLRNNNNQYLRETKEVTTEKGEECS